MALSLRLLSNILLHSKTLIDYLCFQQINFITFYRQHSQQL